MATTMLRNKCPEALASSSHRNEIMYQIILQSSDDSDEDLNESVYSLQAETTVSARDTSDITTEYESELEIVTSEDEFQRISNVNSTTSSENSSHQIHIIEFEEEREESKSSNDDGCEVSSANGSCSSDSYTKLHRFPKCVMCSSPNENDFFQFCNACYKRKKGSFPEMPKGRKRRRVVPNKSSDSSKRMKSEIEVARDDSNAEIELFRDGGKGEILTSTVSSEVNYTHDSGIESQEFTPSTKDEDKCLACLVETTNALFLHGKNGHSCFCYECAKRIWLQTRRCPICRRKVSNIIRILNC